MNTRKQFLQMKFNQKQQNLFKIVEIFGINSQEAIYCSQELDKIILQLQRLDDLKPLIEFLTYFHGNQDYNHCRNILEGHWKTILPNDKKCIYVGFIHLAIGMHHYRAKNRISAIEMLSNAIKLFTNDFDDLNFLGIDGEKLILSINLTLKNLLSKKPFAPFEIPIVNENLKFVAMENCIKHGFTWFNPNSYLKTTNKQKLRSYDHVFEKTNYQLNFKANIQKQRPNRLMYV